MRGDNQVFCEECGTPILEVRGNTIVVRARHHGHQHVSVIPLARLAVLALRQGIDTTPVLLDNASSETKA